MKVLKVFLALLILFLRFVRSVFFYLLDRYTPFHQFRGHLPALRGNFGPVKTELDVDKLHVTEGRVPRELFGSLYVRNGPNARWDTGDRGLLHWFDGDGMLHGVFIDSEGTARFANRFVRTARFLREDAAGRRLSLRLGDLQYNPFVLLLILPRALLFRAGLIKTDPRKGQGTANTSVAFTARRLLALVENEFGAYNIDPTSLSTRGFFDFGGALRHPLTAHPKACPRTGELHFFGYRLDAAPFLSYSVARADGILEHTCELPLPRPVIMHDFALSREHVVFLDLPMVFSGERLVAGEGAFAWEPRHGARLGILPRRGAAREIRWLPIPPCYVFHTANAYESDGGDELCILACRMARSRMLVESEIEEDELPYLYEWRVGVKADTVRGSRCSISPVEFPLVRPELATGRTRYVYASRVARPLAGLPKMDALVKFDMEQRDAEGMAREHVLEFGPGRYGGECSFVPRGEDEDDGLLVTYVTDEGKMSSEFWVVDALNMSVLARVDLPQRVPYGFHGAWLSPKDLREALKI